MAFQETPYVNLNLRIVVARSVCCGRVLLEYLERRGHQAYMYVSFMSSYRHEDQVKRFVQGMNGTKGLKGIKGSKGLKGDAGMDGERGLKVSLNCMFCIHDTI